MDARREVVKRQAAAEVRGETDGETLNRANYGARALGFAEDLVGEVGGDGDAELFALVGFDHE
jgi:hypothetical protein